MSLPEPVRWAEIKVQQSPSGEWFASVTMKTPLMSTPQTGSVFGFVSAGAALEWARAAIEGDTLGFPVFDPMSSS